MLPTGGGDEAFFQKLSAYEHANLQRSLFDMDAVRVVPSLDLLDAAEKGWIQPILPDYAAILPNVQKVNQPALESFTVALAVAQCSC